MEDGNQHLLRASTKQFLFHKQTRTPESLQWENYLVKTRFRQPEVIDFNLVIKAGKGSDQGYLWYYIQIHKDKISLICHGRELAYGYPFGSGTEVIPEEDRKDHRFRNTITFEEMGYFPLSIDEWVQVEAAVGDEKVKVTLTTDESDVREFTFDTFPGKGGARVYTNAPVDIESFSIENLDHPVQ